jgi:hypothetical protein
MAIRAKTQGALTACINFLRYTGEYRLESTSNRIKPERGTRQTIERQLDVAKIIAVAVVNGDGRIGNRVIQRGERYATDGERLYLLSPLQVSIAVDAQAWALSHTHGLVAQEAITAFIRKVDPEMLAWCVCGKRAARSK